MKNIGKISIVLVMLLAALFIPALLLLHDQPKPARAAAYDFYATTAVTAGDVVVWDSATAYGVKTTTAEADQTVAGVSVETVSASNNCVVRQDGCRVAVNVTGDTVSKGQWLITAATAGKARGVGAFQDGVFARAITDEGTPAADQVFASLMISFQRSGSGTDVSAENDDNQVLAGIDAINVDGINLKFSNPGGNQADLDFGTRYGEVSGGIRSIYVDTSGGDNGNLGTSTSKLATIEKAWDVIPSIVVEPIVIDVGAGTYTETPVLTGKQMGSADAAITIRGTLSNQDTGTAESGGNHTLTDTGKSWTNDEHVGGLVRITGGTGSGQERWILDNDATSLTIAGRWETNPDATTAYSIDDPGTVFSPGSGNHAITLSNQAAVTITWIKFSGGKGGIYSQAASADNIVQSCEFDSQTSYGMWIGEGSTMNLYSNDVHTSGRGIVLEGSSGWLDDNYVHDCGYLIGIHVTSGANYHLRRNYVGGNASHGFYITRNAIATFWAGNNANYIKNHDSLGEYGVYTNMGGMGLSVTSQNYSNNDTDYAAEAASFGYNN